MLYYSERVKYAEQVERFFRHFGRTQVKVIIYEDFKTDNTRVFQNVLRFLGVDPGFEPALAEHNRGEQLKSKTMQRFVHDLTHGKGLFAQAKSVLKTLLPRVARQHLVRAVYRTLVFGPKPEVDSALRDKLKKQFRGEVERISRLLGRDLVAEWGYRSDKEAPATPELTTGD